MRKQTAKYTQYYGDLSVTVFAPRFYYSKSQKKDEYSKQIVFGKFQDLSDYFFEPVKNVFAKLPFIPDLIVVAPSSKIGAFSPTLNSLASRLSKVYGVPHVNVIERIREGKKLTNCPHLEERHKEIDGAFKVIVSMKGLKVVLLDDTKTTGLTSLECAKELKTAGVLVIMAVCLGINRVKKK